MIAETEQIELVEPEPCKPMDAGTFNNEEYKRWLITTKMIKA